jgi:Tol biopolymer transport system component
VRPGPALIFAGLALALGTVTSAAPAAAQVADPLSPHRPWRTLETRHFVVHYPLALAEWTLPVAARLDSLHAAVSLLVGNAPDRRVTVVVADPYNVSNGFAIPFLRTPTMVLWPTPPEPRSGIGEHRGWGELLAVHEYAHIAHLVWASRNPRERLLWSFSPVQLGPITRRAPRWVTEGYATYIEGRLTGSGRPHGTWRPATLRQWALEGRLPTYAQLSAWDAFQGGAMAYLVGSAFLEWLIAQHGEESLTHLWRRMTAVQRRRFADAFAGVYGAPPDELYGRFTVEIMREALEAERLLHEAGLVEGQQFQRLSWATGDPALSPDGNRLAIVLRSRTQPSRVVLWDTELPGPLLSEEERQQLLERDPLDVPPVDWRPRAKEALATLHPVAGRAHDHPRFMPDGVRVLVTRPEPLPDGRMRADLFLWNTENGGLRRVTRGAGIRRPDPSPDGNAAVGVRCDGGICSVVRVELATGRVQTLLRGQPDLVFYRPRYSPAGDRIAVAVQAGDRWRIAVVGADGGGFRYVDPEDGHNRYDAAWFADGRSLACVSDRGGIANLEVLELAAGTVAPLTRTTGAVLAPAPHPADGSVFFLRLHTRGLDLQRLAPDAPRPTEVLELETRLPTVAPRPSVTPPDTFPLVPLEPPRPYGFGPPALRLLPGGGSSTHASHFALSLSGIDPIGRLSWVFTGAAGEPGAWRGAGIAAAWRGLRPEAHGALWYAGQRPSRHPEAPAAATLLDADYAGAALWTELRHHTGRGALRVQAGASLGALDQLDQESEQRQLAFLDAAASARFGAHAFVEQALTLHGSVGETGAVRWQRVLVGAQVAAGRGISGVTASAILGAVNSDAPAFERFVAGGTPPLVFAPLLLPQRLVQQAVPLGIRAGDQVLLLRGASSLAGFQPFIWAVSTDSGFREWYRIVGLERAFAAGPAPLARLPRVRVTGGIGYPLDAPFRHLLRGYLSVDYSP